MEIKQTTEYLSSTKLQNWTEVKKKKSHSLTFMVHKFKNRVTEILFSFVEMETVSCWHACKSCKTWNLNAACLANVSLF